MGRPKKSAAAPAEIEPEEISQDIPDEEPAAVLDPEPEEDDEPAAANGRPVNQAELVRKAVAAGHEKPAAGVAYIKEHFGAEVDPKYYSVAKGQLKKREAKSPPAEPARPGGKSKEATSAMGGYVAPPEKPLTAGEQPDLLTAMEAMKPLIAGLGKEQAHRIIDLLG